MATKQIVTRGIIKICCFVILAVAILNIICGLCWTKKQKKKKTKKKRKEKKRKEENKKEKKKRKFK